MGEGPMNSAYNSQQLINFLVTVMREQQQFMTHTEKHQ